MARQGRIRERQKIRRNTKRRREGWLEAWGSHFGRGVLGAATLASMVFLGYMVYQYFHRVPVLNVGEIRIMGCLNATESELLSLAKIDFKDSLVNMNLQELSSRLARHPWVENARGQRDWSRKALIIEVKERVARALILFDDLYLVDPQGDVFKKADPKERMDLPVITGLTHKEVTQKDPQALQLIRQSLDLLEHLQQRKVFNAKRVSEIHLSRQNGITLFTIDGAMPIRLGSDDFPGKLDRLEKIFPDLASKSKEIEYVDLNYPTKAVVKMRVVEKAPSRKS